MKVEIDSVSQAGEVIKSVRKAERVRMDDLAGAANVGPVFVRHAERGPKEERRPLSLVDFCEY